MQLSLPALRALFSYRQSLCSILAPSTSRTKSLDLTPSWISAPLSPPPPTAPASNLGFNVWAPQWCPEANQEPPDLSHCSAHQPWASGVLSRGSTSQVPTVSDVGTAGSGHWIASCCSFKHLRPFMISTHHTKTLQFTPNCWVQEISLGFHCFSFFPTIPCMRYHTSQVQEKIRFPSCHGMSLVTLALTLTSAVGSSKPPLPCVWFPFPGQRVTLPLYSQSRCHSLNLLHAPEMCPL